MPIPVHRIVVTLLFFASCAAVLCSQSIQIKLVNGKTGRPITERSLLNVWVGHERESPLEIPTDKHGVALLRLTRNENEINVPECKDEHADWEKLQANRNKKGEEEFNKKYKYCTAFEVNHPVFRYADSISVNTLPGDVSWKVGGVGHVAYVPCWVDTHVYTPSWFSPTDFSTEEVLQQGIVTANNCGKATASPEPGQLILFVRFPSNGEYLRQAWN